MFLFVVVAALYRAVSCVMALRKLVRPVRRKPCRDRSTAESMKEDTPPTFTPDGLAFPSLLNVSWMVGLLCKNSAIIMLSLYVLSVLLDDYIC